MKIWERLEEWEKEDFTQYILNTLCISDYSRIDIADIYEKAVTTYENNSEC